MVKWFSQVVLTWAPTGVSRGGGGVRGEERATQVFGGVQPEPGPDARVRW